MQLNEITRKVVPFISADETRPGLSRVCVSGRAGDRLEYAATDGHRLAVLSNGTVLDCDVQACVDPRLLDGSPPLAAILAAHTGEQFPDYRQVIPNTTNTIQTDFDRRALMASCVAIMSYQQGGDFPKKKPKTPPFAHVEIRLDDGWNLMRSEDGEPDRSYMISVPGAMTGGTGRAKDFGINVQYLHQALSAMDTEEVAIYRSDSLDPILISELDPIGANRYLHVIMPTRF